MQNRINRITGSLGLLVWLVAVGPAQSAPEPRFSGDDVYGFAYVGDPEILAIPFEACYRVL